MDKKQIMDVALIPILVLFAIQLVSFATLISSSLRYGTLNSLSLILPLLSLFVYSYTGYTAVKKHNLGMWDVLLIVVIMNTIITLTNTLITTEIAIYKESYTSSYMYLYLAEEIAAGIVVGSLLNGFVALIAALVAKPKQQGAKSTEQMFFVVSALVAIVVIAFVLFYLSTPTPRYLSQCNFPAGISCVATKLSAGTSKLTLDIGQGTGRTMKVNGVSCTQNTSAAYATAPYTAISYFATGGTATTNVTISSGNHALIAGPVNGAAGINNIICTDANGNPLADPILGTSYTGRIYINYTEVETGVTRISVGTFSARYES